MTSHLSFALEARPIRYISTRKPDALRPPTPSVR